MLLSGNGLQMFKRIGGSGRRAAYDGVYLPVQAEYDVSCSPALELLWHNITADYSC